MIQRDIEPLIMRQSTVRPVVTIYGPRQSGKTTLARSCFANYGYINLENPTILRAVTDDCMAFIESNPSPLVIDEVQKAPQLTSAIQVAVDENRDKGGQYILTGSHQPLLIQSVTQSLAGRTALITMLPLSVAEVMRVHPDISTDELMLRGFMPELHKTDITPSEYYRDYFATYIERDVRQLVNIRELHSFQRFLTLLAGRVGQIVNVSSLSGEVGVSSTTLAGWLSILEASFIIFRVQPWFTNISKRIVRSPKIYFTEVGLAAYLLGIETTQQMARDPLRGSLFENMVMADILKQRFNAGRDARLFMLRTGKGFEIDAIIQCGRSIQPIEIKSATAYHQDFAHNILRLREKETSETIRPTVVYDGENISLPDGVEAVNFRSLSISD